MPTNVSTGLGRRLLSVQVVSINAGTAIVSPTSGSFSDGLGGTVKITPNSIRSTEPNPTQLWDALYFVARPGKLASGTTVVPDLRFTPLSDGHDYRSYMLIDMYPDSNMSPPRNKIFGERAWLIGKSMLGFANGVESGRFRAGSGYAQAFTGIPVSEALQLEFYSTKGFAATDFAVPPQVDVFGDILDQPLLDFINSKLGRWTVGGSAHIHLQSPRRRALEYDPFDGDFTLPGEQLSPQNFTAKPNGWAQVSAVQVRRLVKYSRPMVDVAANSIFALSNSTKVGGVSGNVDALQQLGWQYAGTANAVWLTHVSRRPQPAQPVAGLSYGAGYFGLTFDGAKTVFPNDTAYGVVCSVTDNPVPFGIEQPQTPGVRYNPHSRWGAWSPDDGDEPELIFDEDAAMTITGTSTISGTTTASTTAGATVASVDETAVLGLQFIAGGRVA